MSQNYYIPNVYGLNKGLSEISNFSIPSINYPLQTNQILSNAWFPTSNSEFHNMQAFYPNPEQFQPLTMSCAPNFDYKKENLAIETFKIHESESKTGTKADLLCSLRAESPVIESSSTTNLSKSNEVSSENKK